MLLSYKKRCLPNVSQCRKLLWASSLVVLCSFHLWRRPLGVSRHPSHKETTTEMKWQTGASLATIWTAAEKFTFSPTSPPPAMGPFSSHCKEPRKWLIRGQQLFLFESCSKEKKFYGQRIQIPCSKWKRFNRFIIIPVAFIRSILRVSAFHNLCSKSSGFLFQYFQYFFKEL